MVKQDGAETRRERISDIARFIQAAFQKSKETGESEELSLSKLVSTMMFQKGLTKEKVTEYLDVIQAMGQIELDLVNDRVMKPQV
jgi:hypothetical protein